MSCPRCGKPTQCLGGCSAHPLNWYCSDEKNCGWQAWTSAVKNEVKQNKTKQNKELRKEKARQLIREAMENVRYAIGPGVE